MSAHAGAANLAGGPGVTNFSQTIGAQFNQDFNLVGDLPKPNHLVDMPKSSQ